jgi:hypothetical protein
MDGSNERIWDVLVDGMTTQNSLSRDMLLESKEKSRKPI